MSNNTTLSLFAGFGIELEYMIVDRDTLSVKPLADEVIKAITGEYTSDADLGEIEWSNELVLHVIELKTNGPATKLTHLEALFHQNVQHINQLLAVHNAMLMPTATHPWMDPHKEATLWPHDYSPVYETYNRIFDCRGHGWANLQSTHINLPFANDEEFGRLHAAIRLLLPLLPALAAASPVLDKQITGIADTRLEVYRQNQSKVPMVAGVVIPEPVFSETEYHQKIFTPLFADIAPHDPEGILQYEWLNSRGAIARFDRNTIEIRVLDIQECPKADLAIAAFIVEVLKALVNEKWTPYTQQQQFDEHALSGIFLNTVKEAEHAHINHATYLAQFGISDAECKASDVWKHLFSEVMNTEALAQYHNSLNVLLYMGTLSTRIVKALGPMPDTEKLKQVYTQLCQCLADNQQFLVDE